MFLVFCCLRYYSPVVFYIHVQWMLAADVADVDVLFAWLGSICLKPAHQYRGWSVVTALSMAVW